MKMKLLFVFVTNLAICGLAIADSATDSLYVSATNSAACKIISVTPLVFPDMNSGDYVYGNGEVTVNCVSEARYYISLDVGQFGNAVRIMRLDGSNQSSGTMYWLFKDTDLTQEWGDSDFANTYPNGSSLAGIGNGSEETHTVYGKSIGGFGLPVGTYTDTVLVTVNF